MRISIANYLNRNKVEIFRTDNFLYIKNLIPQEFLNKNDKTINLDLFIKERIHPKTSEAEICMPGISALLFNVNLELNLLEGFAKDNSQLKFFRTNFPCRISNAATKKISLFHRNSRWSIVYNNQFINLHKNFLKEFNLINLEKIEEKFNTIDFECEKCKEVSKILYIKKYKKYCFCLICIKKHSEKIMEKRKKFFLKANYQDKECKKFY